MIVLQFIYALAAVCVFCVGLSIWGNGIDNNDNDLRRTGARLMLAAPVWPLAFVGVLIRDALRK